MVETTPRGKAQALSLLLAVLPFAAHGQPAAPTGLSATPGDGSATLAWSNPSDSTITGYSYRFATSAAALAGAAWNAVAGSGAATTSHTVTGLANGTRYHFALRAANADGDGSAAQTTIQLAATPGAVVALGDAALRGAVESALGKSAGATVTQLDMAKLRSLGGIGVADLTGLEHAVNLGILVLQSGAISDVSALGALTSLMALSLGYNAISDISPLGALTSLTSLWLYNNAITDVSALGALTSLTLLSLAGNTITDVSALGALTSLTSLHLGFNAITDVSALGTLTALTRLDLYNNTITDVSALGTLTALTSLSLFNNTITDVSGLGTLTSLTWLSLGNNAITDISALGTLASLTSLWLYKNTITDVSSLGTLTSLTRLWLFNNTITDVSALGALTALTSLSLDNNAITDISALGTLTALTELHLPGNAITDISALGALTSLTALQLHNNVITDVSVLGALTALTDVYLHNNAVSDISALTTLASLELLNVEDNPLGARSLCDHIPALRARGVRVILNAAPVSCGPPPAPDLTIAARADGRVALGWTPVAGSGYEWRRARGDGAFGEWTAVSDGDAAAGSHVVEGLAGGFVHAFELRAVTAEPGPATRAEVTLPAEPRAAARIESPGLAAAVARALGGDAAGSFTRGELATVTALDLSRSGSGAPPSTHGAGAAVADLSGVELLVNLRRLNLDGNAVRDLAPLLALRHLAWLSARGQALTSESVRVHIPALRARGVEVLFDPPVAAALADAGLRLGVERALGKAPGAELTAGDLLTLRELDAASLGVRSLAGLGVASGLERLALGGNRVEGLGELSGLGSLRWLDLSDNGLSDVSALSALTGLTGLLLGGNGLSDLSPLSGLTGLTALSLPGNAVADVSALSGLTALEELSLTDNMVSDVSGLAGLTRLARLRLGGNRIGDARPLRSLVALERLWLGGNGLGSLAALSGLSSLEWLDASDNRVSDVSPLADMASLSRLRLGGNRIADVGPLASGSALDAGDVAGLRGNPLSSASLARHVPALRERGVAVLAGVALPYFPAASEMSEEGGGREGFARVANRSAEAGEVLVTAVDAAGTRRGPARLALGAGRTAHFNSRDLEDGNAGKGLWPGVGSPGVAGAWRLELETALDVEAVAYVRASDGFVAPVAGGLPRAGEPESLRAGVFNPGRNHAQRSVLRVWNPGAAAEAFTVWGVDDAGSGRLATGHSAPAGGAVEIGAARLEATRRSGFGLGLGEGKWRLSVQAPWPVAAMSLLESAGSRVSDLSAPASAGVDGLWRAPLFPAASEGSPREGFVRVSNRSAWPGEVLVTAVDDGGRRAGPVALSLDAVRTVHFNARDLRDGAPEKGLAAGVGEPATGDWRLEFASALDLRVSSFARSADGFLTSLVESAPRDVEGAARVFFLNPGSNRNQASRLRLVNDGDEAAEVAVSGVDDAGVAGGEVRLTVPPGAARTLTAALLEAGGEDVEGALGDGAGKWRLTVASDNPVTVMSLLESATGHLANLSAGGKR